MDNAVQYLLESEKFWRSIPQPQKHNVYMPDLIAWQTIDNFKAFEEKISKVLEDCNVDSFKKIPDKRIKNKCIDNTKYALFRTFLNDNIDLATKSRSFQLMNEVSPDFSGFLLSKALNSLLNHDNESDRAIKLIKNPAFQNCLSNLDNASIPHMAFFMRNIIYAPNYQGLVPVEKAEITKLLLSNNKFKNNLLAWCNSEEPKTRHKEQKELINNTKLLLKNILPKIEGSMQIRSIEEFSSRNNSRA